MRYKGSIARLIEYGDLHKRLFDKLKILHPVSEPLGTIETPVGGRNIGILNQILEEIRTIRKALDK